MNLGMFEQPYNDSAYADSIIFSQDANAFGQKTQDASVVMIKNDGVLNREAEGLCALRLQHRILRELDDGRQ